MNAEGSGRDLRAHRRVLAQAIELTQRREPGHVVGAEAARQRVAESATRRVADPRAPSSYESGHEHVIRGRDPRELGRLLPAFVDRR